MTTKPVNVAVVKVSRSATNPKMWFINLACGHGHWVSAVTRPSRKKGRCEWCRRYPKEK